MKDYEIRRKDRAVDENAALESTFTVPKMSVTNRIT